MNNSTTRKLRRIVPTLLNLKTIIMKISGRIMQSGSKTSIRHRTVNMNRNRGVLAEIGL